MWRMFITIHHKQNARKSEAKQVNEWQESTGKRGGSDKKRDVEWKGENVGMVHTRSSRGRM